MRTLVWFRGKDLRVHDHAPLRDAVADGTAIPVFVLDPYFFSSDRASRLPHRMQFLLDGLGELAEAIGERGSRLLLFAGRSVDVIPRLADELRVDRVVAHRWVEPFGRERDRRVADALSVPFHLYEGETLLPPGLLRTGGGTPYAVFTPFSRSFLERVEAGRPLAAPRELPPLPRGATRGSVSLPTLGELGIERNSNLPTGGTRAARKRLRRFLRDAATRYPSDRDRMDLAGTSRLSADIKFGTLSIRSVWRDVEAKLGRSNAWKVFRNELIWREFTHSTLWDRPELLERPFRAAFEGFPWQRSSKAWNAWTAGRTGYPIVDAAARQLLGEGFVHNRARMITASFLCKHLLIDYRQGEAHFMRHLVDGDWAQNNAGWQWSAGCGCDAQPYFRIFNPMTQGKRYDPHGDYVRRWLPELAQLEERYIHAPWTAPTPVLEAAGVRLDDNYPRPIVDHKTARERFLMTARTHLRRPRPT